MQATIDIDDQLLQTAMEMGQLKTEKETIGMALQKYVQMLNNEQILSWRGNVHWDGDLNEMHELPEV